MMQSTQPRSSSRTSRRDFLKTSAVAGAAMAGTLASRRVHAAGSARSRSA